MTDNNVWDRLDNEEEVSPGQYVEAICVDSPVPSSTKGRDREMQMLFLVYLVARGTDQDEAVAEAMQSRVNTRQKFLGRWSNDGSPFTEDEVREARDGMAKLGVIDRE